MIRCSATFVKRFSSLHSLSPLDGRYSSKTASLAPYFSQAALMRYRILVQSQWLLHMLQHGIVNAEPGVSHEQTAEELKIILNQFDTKGAEAVKQIQKVTNHDLKSVEYYLKDKVSYYKEHIHFCCTSEDINNLSYSLMLRDALNQVFVPTLVKLQGNLCDKSENWASHAMLAHTHGQPASPTTLGKQFANFAYRLAQQIHYLKSVQINGKFNGAVGNYNAHYFVFPNLNWPQISQSFVQKRLGLKFNPYTTQIESHDSLCRAFTQIGASNTILIGFCRDVWEYISKGYLKQKTKAGEVGSSTMPHKVNPIDFQNCEGNLGVANSLIDHFRSKLPISRQQRDLSDSTVLRNQGSALGYSMIGYDSLLKGLGKIDSNEEFMKKDLNEHLEVITQAIQTELRKIGYPKPYQLLKELSRGKSFTDETYNTLLQQLKGKVPSETLEKLQKLKPTNYLGKASQLAKSVRNNTSKMIL